MRRKLATRAEMAVPPALNPHPKSMPNAGLLHYLLVPSSTLARFECGIRDVPHLICLGLQHRPGRKRQRANGQTGSKSANSFLELDDSECHVACRSMREVRERCIESEMLVINALHQPYG
jgi:hypothetical protein